MVRKIVPFMTGEERFVIEKSGVCFAGFDGLFPSAGRQLINGHPALVHQAVGIKVQCGFGRAVAQQRADRFHIDSQFQQTCGKAMPERVKMDAGHPQRRRHPLKAPLDGPRVGGLVLFSKHIGGPSAFFLPTMQQAK